MCPVERFPLLGGFQCTNFSGRAGNNVCYIEVGCYWEGPLIEVPLYYHFSQSKFAYNIHNPRLQLGEYLANLL